MREERELTEEDKKGENVNPILLKETLLRLWGYDLTLGCKWWGCAQLRPRVAFDQILGHMRDRRLSFPRTDQNGGADLVGRLGWILTRAGASASERGR